MIWWFVFLAAGISAFLNSSGWDLASFIIYEEIWGEGAEDLFESFSLCCAFVDFVQLDAAVLTVGLLALVWQNRQIFSVVRVPTFKKIQFFTYGEVIGFGSGENAEPEVAEEVLDLVRRISGPAFVFLSCYILANLYGLRLWNLPLLWRVPSQN